MTPSTPRDVLDRFRRYQHLLMFGGGAVVTAVVLVAFVLNTVATVGNYVALEQQELLSVVSRLTDLNSRNVVLMQNGVRIAEVAWRAHEQAEPRLVQQFIDEGQLLRLQQAPDHLPVLVVGASSATPPDSLTGQYIRLAKQLSQTATAASERNGGLLTFWVYRPDRPLLILLPAPGDAPMATLLADRAAFFFALTGPGGNLLVPRDAPLVDPRTAGRAFRWLTPYDSPLSGRRSVRVAATMFDPEQKPFAVAVYELPVTIITAALGENGLDGSLMLFSRNGQVITSFSRQPVDPNASDTARALGVKGIAEPTRRVFRDGHMLFGWPIGETGATLVFVQSWRSIASALTGQIGTSAATTGVVLLVVWSLILLFNRRVFLPVLARSRRVFESEHLSRTLIETAPVGLGLIAVESGQPLLRSPTMIEAAARVVLPAVRTLSAELVHRHRQRADASAATGISNVANEAWSLPTHEGGTMDLSVSVVPARYQGQDVLVTAFTDVTAEKRLEWQLREAKQAADSANAAKSAFLAAMSHEIRTPLNAILGNLELLSYSQLDALQRDRLKTIRSSSDGLLAIVSDVLDFSKIEAGEMTLERIVFDAQEVTSRALTMFGPIARAKGVRLSGEFGTSTTQPMQGDPTRLGQVMNNLLSNAIKFSGHGEVILRLSVVAGRDNQSELLIEVEDNGIGILPEQQAMLFRAFSQADTTINRRFGGTGLGLALCARLTDAMGGTIALHSVPGEGSLFTVRVPLGDCHGELDLAIPHFAGERVLFVAAADTWHAYGVPTLEAWRLKVQAYRHPAQIDLETLEDADTLIVCGEHDTWHADDVSRLLEASSWMIDCSVQGPAYPIATGREVRVSSYGLKGLAAALRHTLQGMPLEATEETQRVLSRRLKVLVAEDNAVNRELFSEQLKMLGCEPVVAEDGLQALECLSRERFDVLVTDLAMPELDGYGLVREAQARWPEMPIVVATASVTQEERARCEAAGVMRLVAKPLQLDELSATLSEVTGVPGVPGVAVRPEEQDGKREGMLGGRPMPAHVRTTFLKSCEEALATIHAACDAGDADRILRELHSLRGALNVFGYHALAEQCAQMEVAISKEGLGAAQNMIDGLDSQLSTLFPK